MPIIRMFTKREQQSLAEFNQHILLSLVYEFNRSFLNVNITLINYLQKTLFLSFLSFNYFLCSRLVKMCSEKADIMVNE